MSPSAEAGADRLAAANDALAAASPHRIVFVGGVHKSGTTLLGDALASHPLASGLSDTGAPRDEGQHVQTVIPPAKAVGGPGRFGFAAAARLDETSPRATPESARRMMAEWGPHWDLTRPILVEKSPPNLIRMRFLQALFPEAAFVTVLRHPVAVAYATAKWRRRESLRTLIRHWVVAHEL
jgi:hypothetical protein